ncbi:prepilin-type N-terminal cleavage/methylation domain-containing protein [Plesiomonas sp.]|uniref:prepilin-type N-terminal cleavage/methylation domain-containing protein n=1 Tax=Plesiomonas sp. TaxID=2486279 RepID=UPI003F336421
MQWIKRGFTLVELMIAMLLGSIIILSVGEVLTSSNAMIRQFSQQQRLDTELNALALRIGKDLRRAGYLAQDKVAESQSNFDYISIYETPTAIAGKDNFKSYISLGSKINTPIEPNNSCVMFTYDFNKDGCFGLKQNGLNCFVNKENKTKHLIGEVFGYRKNGKGIDATNNTMNSASSEPVTACTFQGSSSTLPVCNEKLLASSACNSDEGNWESITDSKFMVITDFKVEEGKSKPLGTGAATLLYRTYDIYIKASLVSNSTIQREIKYRVALENPLR